MGTVYSAWQKSIGREVAIKLMDRSYSRDAMAVRRFLREARLASQLSQPNTVSIFDFGQSGDGRLFIAMELIRGRTLHEVVKTEGAFSIERCVRIGIQICDALEAAHTAGIVHRDLKLENVIVLDHPPGRDLLKVLDFGLAKNIRDPGSRATESGIVVGTPRYMSPEAATTGATIPAGDLYSLGVILGELAVGKPMWTGDTLTELIAQKMDPRSVVAGTPAPLRPLMERLLDPDPDRRPTAAQVRTSLAGIATAEPGAADTVVDGETEAGATTNLRSPSAPVTLPTRQLTPGRFAVAPTATPQPGVTPDGSSPSPQSASPSLVELDQPSARRWPVLVIGAGAVAATVLAVIVATRDADAPRPRAMIADAGSFAASPLDAPLVAGPEDAPSLAQPAKVKLEVTSQPSGATVKVGKRTETTPFEVEVERGSLPIELVARLPGRPPTTLMIIPDMDKRAVIKLLPRLAKPGPSDEATPF
jgi:serine/threonine-protein kinase